MRTKYTWKREVDLCVTSVHSFGGLCVMSNLSRQFDIQVTVHRDEVL